MNQVNTVPLSVYVLTFNSAEHIAAIVTAMLMLSDDVLLVDSGSTDNTVAIAENLGARVLVNTFVSFSKQRQFALDACLYDWVLSLDSDELPDAEFIAGVQALSLKEGVPVVYAMRRYWQVLGQDVHACYPVASPDYPVRLFNKNYINYTTQSNRVHEFPMGVTDVDILPGRVKHITFATVSELNRKLEHYTDLAAQDLADKSKRKTRGSAIGHAIAAFFKFYIIRKNILDGKAGVQLAWYASRYTYLKYKKLHAQ